MSIIKVYGGAGCGKTHFLTSTISNLLDGGCHPRNICMITLTRNARDEFVKRVKNNTGVTKEDLTWFSTMHSVAGKLLGHSTDWMTSKDEERFKDSYYVKGAMFKKLNDMNQNRRNCLEKNDEDGIRHMQALTGMDTWYNDGNYGGSYVKYDEIMKFGKDWAAYMELIGKYDFTRAIEECLSSIRSGNLDIPFNNLFVDEFQDFSPLQYALYREIAKNVKRAWICGDDYQAIYRFSGSSPHFLIETACDEEIILPKTYRFGEEILQNSLKYVSCISVKKDRTISPSGEVAFVRHVRGGGWVALVKNLTGSTVYLTRSNRHVHDVRRALSGIGIKSRTLEASGEKPPAVVTLYNSIRTLDGGGEITGGEAQKLVKSLPATTNGHQLLKRGVKTKVKDILKEAVYNSASFAAITLSSRWWDASIVLDNASGVREMMSENETTFPNESVSKINHFVGTIHKFKGNEADNVVLFTQIPYPFSKHLNNTPGLDEELRTMYVGATRAKTNLIEVSDYLFNANGSMCENVSDYLR